jgi:ParB-like chromosome segregation protein Spo0J
MKKTTKLKIHPLCAMVPKMSAEAFDELKADIEKRGLIEPIWIKGDEIVDGRHRYRACVELGISPATRQYEGDDIEAFVIAANVRRRQLSRQQRSGFVRRLLQLHPERSDRVIAVAVGVSNSTVSAMRRREDATVQIAQPAQRIGKDGKAHRLPQRKSEHRAPVHPAATLVNRQDFESKKFLRWLHDLHPSELTDAAHFVAELETQMRRLSSLMTTAATA